MKIVIVGCGVVGAAIAYELSLIKGLQITVIDQNQPASGSTGAALGILMGAISHKKKGRAWQLREASLRRYETLIPELEETTGIQIPVNRQGIVKLLFEDENLDKWQKLREFRQKTGWELQIWDSAELQHKCPQINREKIIAAVYSPQDRQIHPRKLTEALVAGATQNGVEFRFDVRCHPSMVKSPNGSKHCYQLQSDRDTIDLDYLIISAGLGSTPLTTSLQATIPIRPVLGQALRLKLHRDLGNINFQPVITGDDIHLVPLGEGQYWLGATVEFPDNTGEVTAQAELLEQVKHDAIAFCPALANATVLETWSGKRPRPEGIAAPIIGQLSGYNNVLLATGHYRNGVLLAPATALQIKQALNIKQ
jgi:glycine/D-amino acid oxidase-like deaminating enzyme